MEVYLATSNGKEAAIEAGCPPKTAKQQGCNILKRPRVQAAIAEGKAKLAAKSNITAERVISELAKIGFANLCDAVEWGPGMVQVKPSTELSEDTKAAIREVEYAKGRGLRVKMHDKAAALTSLGKYLGLFEEKQQITQILVKVDI